MGYIGHSVPGDDHCEWKVWFKSRHYYDKLPAGFDLATWQRAHNALVSDHVKHFRSNGYRVTVEDQNQFWLRGRAGTVLSGKPDIVAVTDTNVLVVDCKSGARRPWHPYQVMLYMLSLPLANHTFKGKVIDGRVQYADTTIELPASCIDDAFREVFKSTMVSISGESAPIRVPSSRECRFCDISARYCADRIERATDEIIDVDDLF